MLIQKKVAILMNRPLIIIGQNGISQVIKDIVDLSYDYEVAGFLDTDIPSYRQKHRLFYDNLTNIAKYQDHYFFALAVTDNAEKHRILQLSEMSSVQFPTLVHPSAVVSPTASIGQGTIVMPNAVVHADATLGEYCVIYSGAVIETQCTLGDYVSVASNVPISSGSEISTGQYIALSDVIKIDTAVTPTTEHKPKRSIEQIKHKHASSIATIEKD